MIGVEWLRFINIVFVERKEGRKSGWGSISQNMSRIINYNDTIIVGIRGGEYSYRFPPLGAPPLPRPLPLPLPRAPAPTKSTKQTKKERIR